MLTLASARAEDSSSRSIVFYLGIAIVCGLIVCCIKFCEFQEREKLITQQTGKFTLL